MALGLLVLCQRLNKDRERKTVLCAALQPSQHPLKPDLAHSPIIAVSQIIHFQTFVFKLALCEPKRWLSK